MTCDDCARAKVNPRTAHFTSTCQECQARQLAHSPEMAEAAQAGALTPKYRARLQAHYGADWQKWHERVKHYSELIRQHEVSR